MVCFIARLFFFPQFPTDKSTITFFACCIVGCFVCPFIPFNAFMSNSQQILTSFSILWNLNRLEWVSSSKSSLIDFKDFILRSTATKSVHNTTLSDVTSQPSVELLLLPLLTFWALLSKFTFFFLMRIPMLVLLCSSLEPSCIHFWATEIWIT